MRFLTATVLFALVSQFGISGCNSTSSVDDSSGGSPSTGGVIGTGGRGIGGSDLQCYFTDTCTDGVMYRIHAAGNTCGGGSVRLFGCAPPDPGLLPDQLEACAEKCESGGAGGGGAGGGGGEGGAP